MELKTIQTLKDSLYRVRFETTASVAEVELVSDFGEPTISMGGNFYGNVVEFAATPTIGSTITQGAAVGVYSAPGIVRCVDANLFTLGAAGAYTITSATDASFTLSASSKRIFNDSPIMSTLNYDSQARIFVSEIESRFIGAVNTLRANEDTFSSEIVKTF